VRRGVALVFLLALVAHAPSLFPGGPLSTGPGPARLVPDEGTVVYDSARIAAGELMYADFFEFQGPVFYHLTAAAIAVGGPTLTSARVLHVVVTAAAAAMIFWIATTLAGAWAGAGAAAIHVFLLVPVWPYTYPHWVAEALVLAGVIAAMRGRWLGAGALFGLATFTIQSIGLPALVAVGVAAGLPTRSVRVPLRVLAGALLAIAPILAIFALRGALGELVYAMWIWPFSHYGGGQEDAAVYASHLGRYIDLHDAVALPWRWLAALGLVVVAALPIAGLAGGAIAGLRGLRKDAEPPLAGAAAIAAVAPVVTLVVRHDLAHLAFVGGLALVGVATLCRARAGAAILALVGLLSATSYAAKTARTWSISREMGGWRDVVLALPNARLMDRQLAPDAQIVVGTAGGFYYLYVRPAAVAHTYLPAESVTYFSEAQWQRVADEIAERRPAFLILVGKQWDELRRRRPEIDRRYDRPTREVFVLQ
jgi:hypothetical protein